MWTVTHQYQKGRAAVTQPRDARLRLARLVTQDSLDDILKSAEHRMTTAIEVLGRDLQSVRTGRASPTLLDRIQVDYYGSPTPLNGVANISAPDPRLVVVQPWDRTHARPDREGHPEVGPGDQPEQ